VFDQDKSSDSRAYLEKFKHSEYFNYADEASGYGEIEKDFLSGRAKLAIVVPTDFSKRLFAGRDAPVQILVDGSDANTAVQAAGNAARMTLDYSGRLTTSSWAWLPRPISSSSDIFSLA